MTRQGPQGQSQVLDVAKDIDVLEEKQSHLRQKIKKDIKAFNKTQTLKEQTGGDGKSGGGPGGRGGGPPPGKPGGRG